MAARAFHDRDGCTWHVWKTVPQARRGLPAEFAQGWLTFESVTSRRRLAPVPSGWEEATDERLMLMCRAAVEVPRLAGPARLLDTFPPATPPEPDLGTATA